MSVAKNKKTPLRGSARRELLDLILRVKRRGELEIFLVDLLTPQEMKDIVKRWQIIKQLARGVPQRDISKKLKVSIEKITRGSRMLLNKNGGFNKVLRKYAKKK